MKRLLVLGNLGGLTRMVITFMIMSVSNKVLDLFAKI